MEILAIIYTFMQINWKIESHDHGTCIDGKKINRIKFADGLVLTGKKYWSPNHPSYFAGKGA